MIFVTGDTHGDFDRVPIFISRSNTRPDDVLIILGDAGINFWGAEKDKYLKDYLATLPLTLFCVHGNHEQRPESLDFYDEVSWRGGTAYIEAEYPNLVFAKDGEIYDLGGCKTILFKIPSVEEAMGEGTATGPFYPNPFGTRRSGVFEPQNPGGTRNKPL